MLYINKEITKETDVLKKYKKIEIKDFKDLKKQYYQLDPNDLYYSMGGIYTDAAFKAVFNDLEDMVYSLGTDEIDTNRLVCNYLELSRDELISHYGDLFTDNITDLQDEYIFNQFINYLMECTRIIFVDSDQDLFLIDPYF